MIRPITRLSFNTSLKIHKIVFRAIIETTETTDKLKMFRRFYHTSCILFSQKKQGLKLCKMINPKSKRQWYSSPLTEIDAMPSVKSLTKVKYEPGKRGLRRMAMLNKMFMKYITDIMSTGTVSMNIVGRGVEISKVRVSPDFQTVNVFWVCKGDGTDSDMETLLDGVAGALRHELSSLRLMGQIPYVVFVKDKQEAQLVDLDRRLSTADYGEDYAPTELGDLLKSEFTLNMKLSPEMQAKIKQLEVEEPIGEEPVPTMTHTVFGLDHEKIMNRLLAARKKSREAWSTLDDPAVISYRATTVKEPDIDVGKQKKDLAEFLLKRQILQNKLYKEMRKQREDLGEVCEANFEDDVYDNHYEYEDEFFYEESLPHEEDRSSKR